MTDQIVLGILCAAGFAAFALVLAGTRPSTDELKPYAPPVTATGGHECHWVPIPNNQDSAYPVKAPMWRCHGCGWKRVGLPDCAHDWEYVGGDKARGVAKKCSLCGSSSLTFHLGDLHPGESKSIRFGVSRD